MLDERRRLRPVLVHLPLQYLHGHHRLGMLVGFPHFHRVWQLRPLQRPDVASPRPLRRAGEMLFKGECTLPGMWTWAITGFEFGVRVRVGGGTGVVQRSEEP